MTLSLMDPLLTDGSDDGVYTISVQPVDRLGVSGEVRQFTITYDTQKPPHTVRFAYRYDGECVKR